MYVLYGGDFTRSVLVQWVLEEGGLDYELRKVDIFKGEHRASAFLAIDPAGLEQAERMAQAYAGMMPRNSGGVIA